MTMKKLKRFLQDHKVHIDIQWEFNMWIVVIVDMHGNSLAEASSKTKSLEQVIDKAVLYYKHWLNGEDF